MNRSVSGSVRLPRDGGRVFELLTDYSRYPTWLPDVLAARVLAREGDVAVVELRSPTFGPDPLSLEVVATPGEELEMRQTDRYSYQGLSCRWRLTDEEGASTVELELRSDGPWWSFGTRGLLRGVLDRTLEGLRFRFDSDLADHGGRHRLFAIVRRGDRLTVEAGGESIDLVGGDP